MKKIVLTILFIFGFLYPVHADTSLGGFYSGTYEINCNKNSISYKIIFYPVAIPDVYIKNKDTDFVWKLKDEGDQVNVTTSEITLKQNIEKTWFSYKGDRVVISINDKKADLYYYSTSGDFERSENCKVSIK